MTFGYSGYLYRLIMQLDDGHGVKYPIFWKFLHSSPFFDNDVKFVKKCLKIFEKFKSFKFNQRKILTPISGFINRRTLQDLSLYAPEQIPLIRKAANRGYHLTNSFLINYAYKDVFNYVKIIGHDIRRVRKSLKQSDLGVREKLSVAYGQYIIEKAGIPSDIAEYICQFMIMGQVILKKKPSEQRAAYWLTRSTHNCIDLTEVKMDTDVENKENYFIDLTQDV